MFYDYMKSLLFLSTMSLFQNPELKCKDTVHACVNTRVVSDRGQYTPNLMARMGYVFAVRPSVGKCTLRETKLVTINNKSKLKNNASLCILIMLAYVGWFIPHYFN